MYSYPVPDNEIDRLKEVYSLDILDTSEEEDYNSLVELAAFVTGCPTSVISIMDKERQWFKSKTGLEAKQTPRAEAVCAHTIVHGKLMVVEDLSMDNRFKNYPLVNGTDGFRFYAGVPIYSPSGHALGTVCTVDKHPKKLTEQQCTALNAIAIQASKLLELRQKARKVFFQTKQALQLEKHTLQYQIRQQQEENELIGNELHENLAQSVTQALHILKLSDTLLLSKDDIIKRVERILNEVLGNIRQLSYSVSPTDNLNVGSEEKLKQLFNEFSASSGSNITFSCTGDLDTLNPEKLSHLFRIITDHLHSYEQIKGGISQKIYIQINVGLNLDLQITADNDLNYLSKKRMIVFNSIKHRCEMLLGTAFLERVGLKTSALKIQIPLRQISCN